MDMNLEGVKQSKIFFAGKVTAKEAEKAHEERRERSRQTSSHIASLIGDDLALKARLSKVMSFARRVRVSEYQLTNACNIRCEGCWFFEYEGLKMG